MTTQTEHNITHATNELPMYLQRPTSATSQDVSHVLARTFRDVFTRDVISPDTMKNLSTSRGGDNDYHERYVQALQEVYTEKENRTAEAAMLERHIMQAQARAMSADEREINRQGKGHDLGLPPARSHFRSVIDNALLKKHNLISPDDYATEEPPPVPPPRAPTLPSYTLETKSFKHHTARNSMEKMFTESSMFDNQVMNLSAESFVNDDSLDKVLVTSQLVDSQAPNYSWKEQLSTVQREIDRVDLANLHAKTNYLKNPRFKPVPEGVALLTKDSKKKAKEINIKSAPEKKSTENVVVFVASPPIVRFTEYQVGQVYETTVELKNISTSLRPCRVIPPATTYFSVGLGQFPGEHGLVAPGMSCHYTIRFIPDSLGDYDDEIRVQTQTAEPIIVKIQGRRPPPVLSLPETVDVGQCLVGGSKIMQIPLHNAGGAGRFCFLATSNWPSTSFKSLMSIGSVKLEPFEVRPPVLELMHNETGLIEVMFSPEAIETYSQKLTIICDNCHVKHLTVIGQGQVAGVEFTAVDGGTAEPFPEEICDVGASELIRFPNLNPYTYMQKNMVISNKTNVSLPFHWNLIKPHLEFPDPENLEPTLPENRVLDVDSPFSVEPESGTLDPGAVANFKVTFAPPGVKVYHSCLHLILQNIPDFTAKAPGAVNENSNNQFESPNISRKQTEIFPRDVTALELEVKGESEPFKVLLQPYAILLPGNILVGTTVRKQFVMDNMSLSPIVFNWNPSTSNHILEVEPPMGELLPGGQLQFELSVTGSEPGKIDETLLCHVEHLDEPLTLRVSANIKGPEVQIEEPDVDFSLVYLGETVHKDIVISNSSQIPAKWSIYECPEFAAMDDDMAVSEFTFTPSSGDLRPLEVRKIKVEFKPTYRRSIKTVFELNVEDGNNSNISVRAEVQTPQACFLKSQLEMNEVFLDVPTQHKVVLVNRTKLSTMFQFYKPVGSHCELCSLSVEPERGHLGPREEREILVNFTAHKIMEFSDLRIPCHIDGMESPLALGVSCDVKGLTVTYRVAEDKADTRNHDLCLEYGNNVDLGANIKRYLCIRNNSAITAPFNISVESFSARPPTPPSDKTKGFMPNKSQRRSLLGKTPNLADPMSKSSSRVHSEFCAMMLKEGKGAAFTVMPSSGVLHPFCEEIIEITSYSDMWGEYTDRLVCRVEKLDLVHIPIHMTVLGCPLIFQMTATQGNAQPILRFGTHISGIPPITRQMRINNISPYDIRIDWQVFNSIKDDSQLLDLVLTYGKPFPRQDKDGNEIMPTEKPELIQRLPTDFIPNSPDTASTTRQVTAMTDHASSTDEQNQKMKVISVNIRAHDGVQNDKPFKFTPSQMVVPARGFTSVAVALSPYTETNDPDGEDFTAFALGYISLDDESVNIKGKVSRLQHYDLEPIRLNITAHVKPALLTIECTEEDGMTYRTALSDLLNNENVSDSSLRVNSANLANKTGTPLVFQLVAPEPFVLTNVNPNSLEVTAGVHETGFMTLNPHCNIQVHAAFCVGLDLLSHTEELNSNEEKDGILLEVSENEQKLHFKKNLRIQYNNGTLQHIPLHAIMAIPQFELSKENIDFGTCLVGQERYMELLISNRTASATTWCGKIESQSETCTIETFSMTPYNGYLEAYITHVSNSKSLIKIKFIAKDSEDYETIFIFKGLLGERPRRLYVKGRGSYDEKHEALVNI